MKCNSERAFYREKLAEAESRLEQQANNIIVKRTSSNNAVKEYETKLEELTEERENWRDLLYQEKQSHMQTRERCRLTS